MPRYQLQVARLTGLHLQERAVDHQQGALDRGTNGIPDKIPPEKNHRTKGHQAGFSIEKS